MGFSPGLAGPNHGALAFGLASDPLPRVGAAIREHELLMPASIHASQPEPGTNFKGELHGRSARRLHLNWEWDRMELRPFHWHDSPFLAAVIPGIIMEETRRKTAGKGLGRTVH